MKRFSALIPVICLILVSCEKVLPARLELGQTSVSFESPAGGTHLELIATGSWTAWADSPWCRVVPESGNGGYDVPTDLTIICEENPGHAERNCTVTIRSGGLSKSLTVTQNHRDGILLDQQEYNLTPDEQILLLPMWASGAVTAEVAEECRDWLTLRQTKAMQDPGIQVEVKENKFRSRTGYIHLSCGQDSFVITIHQQPGVIHFADPLFEKQCLFYHDMDRSGTVTMDETAGVKSLSLNPGIESLTGLECFPDLESLYIYGLEATSLDVSFLPKLHTLYFDGKVRQLSLGTGNTLMTLDIQSSNLKQLDLSGHSNLRRLFLKQNASLSSIKLTGCTALREVDIQSCALTRLDVRPCSSLYYLYLMAHPALDTVLLDNPRLEDLQLAEMPIENLDFSKCPLLRHLLLRETAIRSMNLDSVNSLTDMALRDNQQLESVRINACEKLYYFNCSNSPTMKSVEISNCPQLTGLTVEESKLSSLILRNLPQLGEISTWFSECRSISVDNLPEITQLLFAGNSLEELIIHDCPSVAYLVCDGNQLSSLSLSGVPNLRALYCKDNLLEELDCSGNPFLYTIECNKNQLRELDLTKNPELQILYCYNNPLLKSVYLIEGNEYLSVGYDPSTTTIIYK